MVNIQNNVSLLEFNTFRVSVNCKFFIKIYFLDDIKEIINQKKISLRKCLILGEGSNILFVNNFSGTVLKNEIKGISILKETQNFSYIKVGGGENWHDFVLYCVKNNLYGVENLSLIPGTVGAAPVQNIGAYGVEVKNAIERVEGIHLITGEKIILSKEECEFSYRNSIFKKKWNNKFLITHVVFCLHKKPIFNLEYHALAKELEKVKKNEITANLISQTVIKIRKSKLPDVKKIGNAGSFFKNPIVSQHFLKKMLLQSPKIPYFYYKDDLWKISAAGLIEDIGFKGKKLKGKYGYYGTYKNHALVLVNYGKTKGKEILQFSQKIQKEIKKKYKITLERELLVI